jgi:hypothetical protein
MKKTYTTLAGAYAAAEKANATRFDLTYNGGMVLGVLDRVYKSKNAITVAKNNLVRYEKSLCALEFTKGGFKWTVVGHFDNEGLLYANVPTSEKTEDKPKATPRKPRTRKPTPAKGNVNAEIAEWVKANDLCTLTEAQEHGFTGKTRNDLWNFKVDLGLRKGKR